MKNCIRFTTTLVLAITFLTPAFAQKEVDMRVGTTYLQKPSAPQGEDVSSYEIIIHPGTVDVEAVNQYLEEAPQSSLNKLMAHGLLNDDLGTSGMSNLEEGFLALKGYDYMSSPDMSIELTFDGLKVTKKEQKVNEFKCKKNGESTTCRSYYYEVSYKMPCTMKVTSGGSVIVQKNLSISQKIEAGKTSQEGTVGYLEAWWEAAEDHFTAKLEGASVLNCMMRAHQILESNLQYVELPKTFNFISAKHNKHNYDDLNKANQKAIDAIKANEDLADENEVQDKLYAAVQEWETILFKARATSGEKKKNRRFKNDRILGHITNNIALAYLYLNQFDKASDYVYKALELNKESEFTATLNRIKYRRNLEDVNKDIPVDEERIISAQRSVAGKGILSAVAINKFYETKVEMKEINYVEPDTTTVTQVDPVNTTTTTNNSNGTSGSGTNNGGNNTTNSSVSSAPAKFDQAKLMDRFDLDKKIIYTNLTQALREPEKVYRLDLSGKNMSSLTPQISRLVNLQELNLSNNRLTTLPNELFGLVYLQYLDLDNNQLKKELPVQVGRLVNLLSLHFGNNEIYAIPESVKNLKRIREFGCDVHRFNNDWIMRVNKWNSNIKMEYKRYTSLSEALKHPAQVQFLALMKADETNLTKDLGKLLNLRRLIINTERFSIIPTEIRNCTHLGKVALAGNIYSVPKEIGYLTNLEVLDISSSKIPNIPNEIGNLKKLRSIIIREGQFSTAEIQKVRQILPGARITEL